MEINPKESKSFKTCFSAREEINQERKRILRKRKKMRRWGFFTISTLVFIHTPFIRKMLPDMLYFYLLILAIFFLFVITLNFYFHKLPKRIRPTHVESDKVHKQSLFGITPYTYNFYLQKKQASLDKEEEIERKKREAQLANFDEYDFLVTDTSRRESDQKANYFNSSGNLSGHSIQSQSGGNVGNVSNTSSTSFRTFNDNESNGGIRTYTTSDLSSLSKLNVLNERISNKKGLNKLLNKCDFFTSEMSASMGYGYSTSSNVYLKNKEEDTSKNTNVYMSSSYGTSSKNPIIQKKEKEKIFTQTFSSGFEPGMYRVSQIPDIREKQKVKQHGGMLSGVKYEKMLEQYNITGFAMRIWMENMKKWVQKKILFPVAEGVNMVNDILKKKHGSFYTAYDCNHKLSDAPAPSVIPRMVRPPSSGKLTLKHVLEQIIRSRNVQDPDLLERLKIEQYLETPFNCPREYLINRLFALSRSVLNFRWNGGGSFRGKKWNKNLPTDSQIILQLFQNYFNSLLPVDKYFGRTLFSRRHFIDKTEGSDWKEKSNITKTGIYLLHESKNPPHVDLILEGKLVKTQPGNNNVFFALALFTFFIEKKFDGYICFGVKRVSKNSSINMCSILV